MIPVTIDGIRTEAVHGEILLDVARRIGVQIPSLCRHGALPPLGSCRLCIVEARENGAAKVVASCAYPITRGCEVSTDSGKIRRDRRVILSMLRDRAPGDPRLLELCAEYHLDAAPRSAAPPGRSCVLCGRCAAACDLLGSGAIATVGRGTQKKVSTPFDEASAGCLGCAACAAVCPINAIPVEDRGSTRTIWNKTFTLVPCVQCGAPNATAEALAVLRAKTPAHLRSRLDLCPICRRRFLSP